MDKQRFASSEHVRRGGETYFSIVDALRLVDKSADEELAVIGVEGVEITEEGVRPVSDAIADFSNREGKPWSEFVQSCRTAAKNYLQHLPSRRDLHVTLTVLSREEWRRYGSPEGAQPE
jgi:hypothetical protein